MMPCVCYHYGTLNPFSGLQGHMVENFLGHDGNGCCREGYDAGSWEDCAIDDVDNASDALAHQLSAHDDQYDADDQGCQRLEFPMPERMITVFPLCRNMCESQHDNVTYEVRQRMNTVRNHRRTMPEGACDKLSCRKQQVDHGSP